MFIIPSVAATFIIKSEKHISECIETFHVCLVWIWPTTYVLLSDEHKPDTSVEGYDIWNIILAAGST